MAKRTSHTVGLDIGTSKVTCIVGEPGDSGLLDIVGIGEAEARGLRKGVIVNPDAAVEAIKRAVEDAERMSGLEAEDVTINLAGSHIMGFNGQAIVAVSGRDREITPDDVRRAIDSACA
ncbi:MAG: cell division protein FtsA, partial [Acidobacteriota bacterium]|nr:cell division protein FtsA [Acidobacteriota bacterium]